MTLTLKIILIALLVLGALCLIVGFTLTHYIGGFLRTVEEEKERETRLDESRPAAGAREREEGSGANQDI